MPEPYDVFKEPQKYWGLLTSRSDSQIEDQRFDRKQAGQIAENGQATKSSFENLKDEIIECVSAFANSNGGLIIVGISKSGDVAGVNHLLENQLHSITSLNQSLRNHAPLTKFVDCKDINANDNRILLIYISASENGICETISSPARAWLRNGSHCEPLTDETREMIKRDRRIVNYERAYCCPFNADEIDQDILREFRKAYLSGSTYLYSEQDFLFNVGAVERDQNGYYFTNAGYLFFANSPQRILTWAYIRLLRFDVKVAEHKIRGLPTFERMFDGALPQQIRKVRVYFRESGFFKSYQRRKPDGGFVDEPEFPPIAIDEAIVNATAHRDFGIQLPMECTLYKDGFVVENPGRINQRSQIVPAEFTLNQINLDSMPRNSKLIEWLKVMKDEDGSAFVRALSEGTKRMRDEMARLALPSPAYNTDSKRTIVALYNNAEEREALLRAQSIAESSTEYANLFPFSVATTDGIDATSEILKNRYKDFAVFLQDALKAKEWYVDRFSFGQITAHRKGVSIRLSPDVEKYIRFYPAYIFQLRDYKGRLYLCLDYTLEVKNYANVRLLLKHISIDQLQGKTALGSYDGWQKCHIVSAGIETSLVHFDNLNLDEYISSDKVIPDLPLELIRKIISSTTLHFDLAREIKKSSLASEQNSSRSRAEKTIATIGELAKTVFPLRMENLIFTLHKTPIPLTREEGQTQFQVHSLPEPFVEFSRHQETPDIRSGITSYGSYQSDPKTIELIPVCLDTMRDSMASLIQRLKVGKYKYAGSERTFSTRFTYNSIVTVNHISNVLSECQRLLSEHPDWIGDGTLGRLFLVHSPEEGFALDDENSPYYQVKRFLLEQGLPCQMVDTPTLLNPEWKDLNLALNIIAKCGVTPWVLPDRIPDADFFIGLSYTQNQLKGLRRLLGYATVFNQYGRWEFYSGNTDTFSYEERGLFFEQLTEQTLTRLSQTNSLSDRPSIYFHYSARYSREDRLNILNAARRVRPKGTYNFVSINSHHGIRLYDNRPETDGSLSRGSYVITGPRQFLISTTGYNPYRKSIGTPKPLEVTVRTEPPVNENLTLPDLKSLANQILSLTKLNWASTDSLCGEPITIKYAGNIAYLTDAFLRQSGSFLLHPVLEKTPWFI